MDAEASTDTAFEEIRTMTAHEMVERSVPGLVVGVAQRGDILWQEG